MTPLFEADLHNFGQCVKRIERGPSTWYKKPRSVFWEHLFFGDNSPIKSIFDSIGSNGIQPLASYLFNLEVESESSWLGYAREVKSAQTPICLNHFYSLGVLIGYCYLFGIRDLHKYNIVICENHLQVIDAEVILTNLILPNETLLLPFKEIPLELSAMSLLRPSLKGFDNSEIHNIFAGYFDVATTILDNFDQIRSTISHEKLELYPARVILKNTKQYRDFLLGHQDSTGFLPEELIQLERGDIPYFFKFIGQDCLWYLSGPDEVRAVSHLPDDLQKDVNRHCKKLEILLTSESAILKKIATGALYLQKVFGEIPEQLSDKRGIILCEKSSLRFRNHFITNRAVI